MEHKLYPRIASQAKMNINGKQTEKIKDILHLWSLLILDRRLGFMKTVQIIGYIQIHIYDWLLVYCIKFKMYLCALKGLVSSLKWLKSSRYILLNIRKINVSYYYKFYFTQYICIAIRLHYIN